MPLALPVALGHREEIVLEFSHFLKGCLGLATMPSRLPPYTAMTKAGSLPSTGVLITGVNGTMNPSDSRPARSPFAVGL